MAKIRKIKEKELVGGTSNTEVYPITHARAVYDKNNTPLSDTLEFLNTEIVWNNSSTLSNMNDFVVAGVYDIKGERTRANDNLPILNRGGGHTFNARLTVLDSSITGDGKNDDKCITQVLSFSNRLGQGEVYIRTGKGSSLDNLTWENWSTLQRNVNVDTVTSLDHLIDNGIYSGVYVKNAAEVETFVMVVINNYAAASQKEIPKSVSQFKYSVSLGGSFAKYETRVGGGNPVSFPYAWEILNKDEITSMISAEIKKVTDGVDPEKIDSIKEIVAWIDAHGGEVTAIYNAIKAESQRAQTMEQQLQDWMDADKQESQTADAEIKANAMQYNTLGVSVYPGKAEIYGRSMNTTPKVVEFPAATTEKAGVMSAEDKKALDAVPSKIESAIAKESKVTDEKITAEINKIKDGDTIVGQAREIHSRNGKTVPDSFLARTTAGSGTIGDGVASLKSVGGNIVKNLVDGTFESGWGVTNASVSINNRTAVIVIPDGKKGRLYGSDVANNIEIKGHIYYQSFFVKCNESPNGGVFIGYSNFDIVKPSKTYIVKETTEWQCVSFIYSSLLGDYRACSISDIRTEGVRHIYVTKPLYIDLTEMFGAGNEPDKATCDRLFGTMDALPQGLTIAKPNTFTSTGFNQFNPDNVLEGKAIDNNAIVPGDKKIAVIPCLPCKVGTGENNGYCIHGDFGDDINVYLTPLNPMEVEGELYMHELTKDATTDTYVPLIKGYMLVEVPTTANLCAHFLWSEDKCERDSYEPYFENKVELPTIPQMSEYGLAGIQSRGTLACDEIDFERGVYIKRIGSIDLGSLSFVYNGDAADGSTYIDKNFFVKPSSSYILSDYNNITRISVRNDGRIVFISPISNNQVAFKDAMQGVMLYYELATLEEYPLPKIDNNYISSDYGVEQFDGVVPCNANNLYYMRSLAGETRNFLDRLMAGLGTSDATVVADRILAVVNPAVEPANVEPETLIEE